MTAEQLDLLAEAERLRDEGMARVTAHSDDYVIDRIDHVIAALNAMGREWSANDAREIVNAELVEYKPQLIGARVRAAAMRKEMVKVGRTPSTLPSTHLHEIAVWQPVVKP